jgi:multidrug efflux pump subunit AcrB
MNIIPVIIGKDVVNANELIYKTKVKNRKGEEFSLSELIRQEKIFGFKKIISGKEGKYLPVNFSVGENDVPFVQEKLYDLKTKYPQMNLSFSGSIFSNKELMSQLIKVMLISLFLLYFILASQFESFAQPLIVLLEVPIDIGGALLILWLAGGTINLMSLIGLVVMSGIIINDSILKIDTINRLRTEGYSLLRAISMAGQRRLKPILMTSLTTILALLPFLFTTGLGSDLQKPLAYTIIGGMAIGTLVSLYFVPLCYHFIYRNKLNK